MSILAIIYLLGSFKVIGDKTFDAGFVKAGTPITHTFKLKNTGKDTIYIEAVKRTCGCTTTQIDKNKIPPNDTFLVTAKVSTFGYNGEISKSLYVFYKTSKGKKKTLKLKIKATIYKNSETPTNVFLRHQYAVILDIRDKKSYSKCHIAGSENIDYKDLISYLARGYVSIDTSSYIFIVAPDTVLGKDVLEHLRKKGYIHSYYIEGGIKNWVKEIGRKGLICSN